MSYNQQVLISSNPKAIFEAITLKVQEWWGNTNSPVTQIGDEFTTSFDETFWKFKVTELIPYSKIVWECIDAKHVHLGYGNIEKEWIGTFVNWDIKLISENESKLLFSHNGLIPELNCYEICTPAWNRFVTQSLKNYIETGSGMPHLT